MLAAPLLNADKRREAPPDSLNPCCAQFPRGPCRSLRYGLFLLHFLEIDTLVHRQPLEVPAQAVEPHFDGAEPHPVAPADDTAAPRRDAALGRDREADRACKL